MVELIKKKKAQIPIKKSENFKPKFKLYMKIGSSKRKLSPTTATSDGERTSKGRRRMERDEAAGCPAFDTLSVMRASSSNNIQYIGCVLLAMEFK